MDYIPCSKRQFPYRINSATLYEAYLRWLRHLTERLGTQNTLKIWKNTFADYDDQFLTSILSSGWQKMESLSAKTCTEVQKRTENPLIKIIAEVIRKDSESHVEVLKLIRDSLTKEALHLTPDELMEIWDLIEGYHSIERKSVDIAEEAIRDSRLFEIRFLLTYLLVDESKHLTLLNQLDDFKRNLFPYR